MQSKSFLVFINITNIAADCDYIKGRDICVIKRNFIRIVQIYIFSGFCSPTKESLDFLSQAFFCRIKFDNR